MSKGTSDGKSDHAPKEAAKSKGEGEFGSALRSVYQKTVDEAVPEEMLDLLSKLE